MNVLGLDVGGRRTGVAFCNTKDDILFSLETISHSNEEELLQRILSLCSERSIEEVVIGLPLLPSGEEGSQTQIPKLLQSQLEEQGITAHLLDERYTTNKTKDIDRDAAAACEILAVWVEKNKEN